jgi:hypothetical protein
MTCNTIAILALAISFLLPSPSWADALLLKRLSTPGALAPWSVVWGRVLSLSPERGILLDSAGKRIVIALRDVDTIFLGADADTVVRLNAMLDGLGGHEGSDPMVVHARIAKAQADARTLVSAISMYSATFGSLPAVLSDLTQTRTMNGVTGGPFVRAIPVAPPGWSEFRYETRAGGFFTISTNGDGTTVSSP